MNLSLLCLLLDHVSDVTHTSSVTSCFEGMRNQTLPKASGVSGNEVNTNQLAEKQTFLIKKRNNSNLICLWFVLQQQTGGSLQQQLV